MKTSLAATLSIVGVLASGAGAFAVNSYVLDSSNDTSYAAPIETVAPQPLESSTQAVSANSVIGSVAEPASIDSSNETRETKTPAVAPTTTAAPAPKETLDASEAVVAPTLTTYNVGDAGRVTLELNGNSLRVVSVLPGANWTAKLPEYDDGEVEVEFYSGSIEVEFKARVVNGEIAVFVESEDESQDDHYEEDDHDDDHHEREDD